MRALSTAFSALAAACFAHAALAQPPNAPPSQQPPPAQAPDIEVTDSDLDTFATIYVDLQSALQEFEARAAEVTTEEEAQQLQAEMQQEGISTIEQHGWSPEQFNRIAQAINADPELVERVTAMIEERS